MPSNRLYDQVFLIVPDKDEQGAAAVIDEFRKVLVANGATFEKDETMGRRRLAYQIHKKTEATYHNFLFRGDGKAVKEVERRMGLSEDVLRYLTVRVDEEMKHGIKVAKRTKVRVPRRIEEPISAQAPPPPPPAAPPVAPPAAPEPAAEGAPSAS